MTEDWIVLGDTTSSGGRMITCSLFTDVDGKGVCRKGDKATCPTHKGVFPITGGCDPTTIIDDAEVALHGATLACGCKVLATKQMRVFLDVGGGGGGAGAAKVAQTATVVLESAATAMDSDSKKSVTRIFWSYGDAETPVEGVSRFYTDLNLHIETLNYQPGEAVEVRIEGADGKDISAGLSNLTFNATVDVEGKSKLMNVFDGQHVELFEVEG